jgi:RimJ/RimL family protein N-acetyltransferase
MALVPDDFTVPERLVTETFVLEPLGPEHNERDHAAWSSSVDHIRATHAFAGRSWPRPMSLAENLADLERHRAEFDERTAFAYTVLDPETDDVIGCVYVDPMPSSPDGVVVRSWVRATHAELDEPLRGTVVAWLEREWPVEPISTTPE